jgi:hypothetical protein
MPKLFSSTLGAPAVSIDTGANGVAGGHVDLLILIYARSDRAANTADNMFIRFNNDSAADYTLQQLSGGNATASASANVSIAEIIGTIPAATAAANVFGFMRCEVLGYDNGVNFPQCLFMSANAQTVAAASSVEIDAGLFKSTTAITRVQCGPVAGTNLLAGSRMVIYGAQ